MSDENKGPPPPLESLHKTPNDPLMEAVQEFDHGLDDVVAGVRRMELAAAKIREKNPKIDTVRDSVIKGLLPWVEKVDNEFVTIFPDMGEEGD